MHRLRRRSGIRLCCWDFRKFVNVVGSDAAVLTAEDAEDRGVDFLQGFGVGGEVAAVDD